jgi:hypothetical protein
MNCSETVIKVFLDSLNKSIVLLTSALPISIGAMPYGK